MGPIEYLATMPMIVELFTVLLIFLAAFTLIMHCIFMAEIVTHLKAIAEKKR
jgi:hypothetical protein